jgi:isopentenyldiphosphate isomerase
MSYKENELFFVVDENNNPQPPLARKFIHGHGVWHRVSHIWILDGKGNVLCQQRAFNKETNPGMWEPFFGGHLSPDDSYLSGAVRELAEETGLILAEQEFKHVMTYKMQRMDTLNYEFQAIYIVQWADQLNKLKMTDGEVVKVEWMTMQDVLEHLESKDPSWTNCGYEIDFIKGLLVK